MYPSFCPFYVSLVFILPVLEGSFSAYVFHFLRDRLLRIGGKCKLFFEQELI